MGLGRFVVTRTLNLVLVLFAVLLLTLAFAGPATDNVLKGGVESYVRGDISTQCTMLRPPSFCGDANLIKQQIEEIKPVSYTHLTLPTTPYV